MPIPEVWWTEEDRESCALVAVDPVSDLGFHANVVVTVEVLADDHEPATWFAAQDAMVADRLVDLRTIDEALTALAGFPARRSLLHHMVDGHAVTLEQWASPVGRHGWVVSASVASLAYDHHADLVAEVIGGFTLHDPEGGTT